MKNKLFERELGEAREAGDLLRAVELTMAEGLPMTIDFADWSPAVATLVEATDGWRWWGGPPDDVDYRISKVPAPLAPPTDEEMERWGSFKPFEMGLDAWRARTWGRN